MPGGEKRFIPGTKPEWNLQLREGFDNAMVDSHGRPYDNGWNFDEKSDDEDEVEPIEKNTEDGADESKDDA